MDEQTRENFNTIEGRLNTLENFKNEMQAEMVERLTD